MTPVATEGEKANISARRRAAQGRQVWLTGQIMDLVEDSKMLPTPTAHDGKGTGPSEMDRHSPGLTAIDRLLGTPRCADGITGNLRDPEQIGNPNGRLEDQVALLPTTRAAHGMRRNQTIYERPADQPQNLENALALLPTPRASDGPNGGPNQRGSKGDLALPSAVVQLLPTPTAQPSGNSPEVHLRKKPGRTQVTDLAIIAENGLIETGGRLLPTPAASDGTGGRVSAEMGGERESGSKRSITLATAVHHQLLPTPSANLGSNGGSQDPEKRRAGGHQVSIQDVAEHELVTEEVKLLQTPATADGEGSRKTRGGDRSNEKLLPGQAIDMATNWGPYEPAIRRWEAVIGRPAPAPTELNSRGGQRLSPKFTEWMMGLPEGWITGESEAQWRDRLNARRNGWDLRPVGMRGSIARRDIPISRNEQLKAAGNGVVPQQAAAALLDMLEAFNATED